MKSVKCWGWMNHFWDREWNNFEMIFFLRTQTGSNTKYNGLGLALELGITREQSFIFAVEADRIDVIETILMHYGRDFDVLQESLGIWLDISIDFIDCCCERFKNKILYSDFRWHMGKVLFGEWPLRQRRLTRSPVRWWRMDCTNFLHHSLPSNANFRIELFQFKRMKISVRWQWNSWSGQWRFSFIFWGVATIVLIAETIISKWKDWNIRWCRR